MTSTNLLAQNYDDPSLGQQPVVAQPQDFKPLGVRAGAFMLHPGVELAAEWTDNVFYTAVDEQSDTIFHIRPYITAQSTWSRHSLSVRLAADFGRYADYTFRDYEDYFFSMDGVIDAKNRNTFDYGVDWMRLHEDLNSTSSEQGIEPTVYYLTGAGLGYSKLFNRFDMGLTADFMHLDYDNAVALNGDVIDNQDRNRNNWLIGAQFGYQFKTDKQAYFSAAYNNVSYEEKYDRNGYDRSSNGYVFNAGMSFTITNVLAGDVSVVYTDRKYDDPTLPGISGVGLAAGLTWQPTLLTTVYANAATSIEETTDQYSSGYFRTFYGARVSHELLRNLQLTAQVSYTDQDYKLLPGAPATARAKDKIWRGGLGVNYFINRSIWVSASYDFNNLSSNNPLDDYKVNRVWFVIGFER